MTKLAKSTKLGFMLILSSLLSLLLSSCGKATYVKCYGVSKLGANHWIGMTSGQCKKLAGSKPEPLTVQEASKITKYKASDYVKCYGIAAAEMNDCGTKTSACGGSVHVARTKDAWIAIPKGLCQQIKGGVVQVPKKS